MSIKLPAWLRITIYTVVTLLTLAVGAWQTSDGDIVTAVSSFLASLSGIVATWHVDTSA